MPLIGRYGHLRSSSFFQWSCLNTQNLIFTSFISLVTNLFIGSSTTANSNECGTVAYFCPAGSGERKPVSVGHYTTPEAPPGSSDSEITASLRTRFVFIL